jgi:predicted nucleic acid-binding protein
MGTEGRRIRTYADTSVFGGVFDEEFSEASRAFFSQVCRARFRLVTSALVREEVEPAPVRVRQFFGRCLPVADVVEVTEQAIRLQRAYVQAGIVESQWAADALHVALATVGGCSLIVSWNFAHIVHFDKVRLYNAVNVLNGFARLAIHSPQEVIAYEDQDS